jgi:voltage-gated potassium channel
MPENQSAKGGPIFRWAQARPFLFLTVALLVILLCMPLATGRLARFIFVELSFFLVLGVAISATGDRRWFLAGALGLWLISTVLDVTAHFLAVPRFGGWILFINEISSLIFLMGSAAILLRFIFLAERISLNSVFAATSSYLLITLIWAFAYSLTTVFDPQAFSMAGGGGVPSRIDLIYFSFVTITTLGYGDIFPLSPFARMLSAVEAVIGQLYLAVLVAWLVGLTISNRRRPREEIIELCSDYKERD